jgi:hypothetical protein
VIDDVNQLFREQARIDGVADIAAAGGGIIGLEVAVVVPGQGGNAVPLFQAPAGNSVGEPARPGEGFPVSVAMARVVTGYRYDFGVAVHLLCVFDYGSNRQGGVHHQAVHAVFLY